LIVRWKRGEIESPAAPVASSAPFTILNLAAAFWRIVEKERLFQKNGKPTSTRDNYKNILRVLVEQFGTMPAAEFGPRCLTELREHLAKSKSRKTKTPRKTKLARSTVNGSVHKLRNVFRVCAEHELIPSETWNRLAAVRALRRSKADFVAERPAVGPVDRATVDATLPHLPADIAAMVELQWHSGARPGEIVSLRTGDVERVSDSEWRYVPQSHKTEDRDRAREVNLGPKAIAVLKPLLKADPAAFVFRLALRPWPTQTYHFEIKKACAAAGIPAWAPNRLRHAFATRARQHSGIEAARVALGHSHAGVTEVYAERDRELARRLAREIG
jgi:integrase